MQVEEATKNICVCIHRCADAPGLQSSFSGRTCIDILQDYYALEKVLGEVAVAGVVGRGWRAGGWLEGSTYLIPDVLLVGGRTPCFAKVVENTCSVVYVSGC